MNFIESFNSKTILIPLLQRDYVQGSKDTAVISPFLDALLEKECDLNYIYGYQENGCFVPVDGQQRLTTLWLLYLYLYACRGMTEKYDIHMRFASREYANDFCERIKEHIEALLPKASLYKSFDEAIKDQNWFIRSWCKNATVNNMLGTLKHIHRKINESNINNIWLRLVESTTPSITFAFLQMDETNGLDDDIYIKMNGRGRKLSPFENLKSWMDEKVSTRPYCEKWRKEMDNAWTSMFWENRNKEQEHPEEIDDEQLFYFYNLLILYHIRTNKLLHTIITIRERNPYLFEELQDFFGIERKANDQVVVDLIIGKLQEGGNIPLMWFERLELMPDEFLDFAFNCTCAMVELSKGFNSMELFIGEDKAYKTTRTYRISMCKGSLDRTLPLFHSLLSYQEGKTSLFDWIRVMRNLILGTAITKDNVARILKSIQSYADSCKEKDIYELLSERGLSMEGSGFNRRQFEEETDKAKWIVEDKEWVQIFNTIEGTSFCKGTIGFIFNYLPEQKNKKIFEEYSTLFHLMFGQSGVRYNISQYNLQRSLMCFTSHYGFGYPSGDKWKFMSSREEWHKFLNDKDEYEGQPHNHCMKLLTEKLYERLNLRIDLCYYKEDFCNDVNTVMSSIIEDMLASEAIKDWRYYFIKYPEVWSSMGRSMCRWINDYNIYVLGSTQWRNGNIRELRSFAFWCDVKNDYEDHKEDYASWEYPNFWYYDDTCMFINHKCEDNRIIAIDVFYERGKLDPDRYRFRLFYRFDDNTTKDVKENVFKATRNEFTSIAKQESFDFNEEDHKYWSGYYSYSEAFSLFKKLVKELGNY